MSNRLVGNVIIVDSGMGNNLILGTSSLTKQRVSAIAVVMNDTSSKVSISFTDTSNVIACFNVTALVSSGTALTVAIENPKVITFGSPIWLDQLKAPIVTASTAWLYLV